MTKEQEEAVEKLKDGKKIDFNTLIRTFKKEGIDKFAIIRVEYIETVLNMLKEKDTEIEKLKEENKNAWNLNANMSKRHLVDSSKIKKKDKIIDLMAKELQKHIFVLYDGDTITSKKGIIEHYERKVEK